MKKFLRKTGKRKREEKDLEGVTYATIRNPTGSKDSVTRKRSQKKDLQ